MAPTSVRSGKPKRVCSKRNRPKLQNNMAASDTDERNTDLSSDDERGFFQMAESDEGNYATTHSLLQPSKGCVGALIRGRLKSVQKRCVAKFMRFRRHSVEMLAMRTMVVIVRGLSITFLQCSLNF